MTVALRHGASALRAPRDATRVETTKGSIAVWTLTPYAYASAVQGHMTPEMSQAIIDHATPSYAAGRTLYGFHDWIAMSGYDSSCRVELTAWIMRNKAHSVLHIGTASRIVAMGVTVARLALGDLLHVHGDRDSLERALTTLLRAPP